MHAGPSRARAAGVKVHKSTREARAAGSAQAFLFFPSSESQTGGSAGLRYSVAVEFRDGQTESQKGLAESDESPSHQTAAVDADSVSGGSVAKVVEVDSTLAITDSTRAHRGEGSANATIPGLVPAPCGGLAGTPSTLRSLHRGGA